MKIIRNKLKKSVRFSIFLCAVLSNFACTPRSLEKPNVVAPQASQDKQASFQTDLETMRTANFEYIFVFRRKDGGKFDGEDRKYLKANSPAETNRFIATDEERAFIAGSKYKFPPESLEALRMRFSVEDYSAEPVK